MNLKTNPYCTGKNLGNGKLLFKVDQDLKILECDEEILNEVLEVIKKFKARDKIVNHFSDRFSKNQVSIFLKTLLDEGIILEEIISDEDKSVKKINILIVGNSHIIINLSQYLEKDFNIVMTDFSGIEEKLENILFSAAIIYSAGNTYEEILKINKLFLEKNLQFLVIRNSGQGICIGPYIIPWKTPCLECHLCNKIYALGTEIDKEEWSKVYSLPFSYCESTNIREEEIVKLSGIVKNELKNLLTNKPNFEFLKTEKTIISNRNQFSDIRIFESITRCRCCNGMNSSLSSSNNAISTTLLDNTPEYIKYKEGGFRSKTKEETQEILKKSFNKIGCKVSIKLIDNNPFSDVLPVYDSILEDSHFNSTPYILAGQISHGKGLSRDQAYFSAAFELFERISAKYYGEKHIITAPYIKVKKDAIDIESLIIQIKNHNTPYEKFDDCKDIDWVEGKSMLTGEKKLIPASMVFLSSSVFRGKFFNNTSSGLAAGAVLEDAALQGMLEIVEHDAWLIGQCNTCELPLLDLNTIEKKGLSEAIRKIRNLGYDVITRDYTNDIGIPVFRTWIVNPDNPTIYATSGFGASLDPQTAVERSLTEAVQSACKQENGKISHYQCANMRDLVYSRDSLYGLYYFQQKDIKITNKTKIKSLRDYGDNQFNNVKEITDSIIQKIKSAIPGCDILLYDLTRESIGIPVVRIIITGDIQRLSLPLISVSKRLMNFQKNMGISESIPDYADLYMGPYPH